jgi:hypothetical protein
VFGRKRKARQVMMADATCAIETKINIKNTNKKPEARVARIEATRSAKHTAHKRGVLYERQVMIER